MTRTIWKYTLPAPNNLVAIPGVDAQILSVQMQGDWPRMWVLVDPNAEKHERAFIVVGTGHQVPSDAIYCGTFQDDVFVGHVFEIGKKP